MNYFFKGSIVFFFIFSSFFSYGQNDSLKVKKKLNNEIGLDLSNTIFLIRKGENMYLLNYKRHIKNHAIRAGVNLRVESIQSGEESTDLRLGYEYKSTVNKWQFFYGADLGYSFLKYNFQGNTITQYIFSPLIGFRYFIHPRFSISTEPKINFKYIINEDPYSFKLDKRTEDYEIALGSIGIVLVNFHF